jgi:hypothetical protein
MNFNLKKYNFNKKKFLFTKFIYFINILFKEEIILFSIHKINYKNIIK